MTDYVAIGFDVAGYVRAFTTGTLNACKAAARTYKRKKNGMRVYPVVKVMTWKNGAVKSWIILKQNILILDRNGSYTMRKQSQKARRTLADILFIVTAGIMIR